MTASEVTRLSLNVNQVDAEFLRAERARGITATATIHHALGAYKYWRDAERAGRRVQVVDVDGSVTEVRLIG